MIRRRLAAVLAALVVMVTGLVATAPAAEAASLGCRYELRHQRHLVVPSPQASEGVNPMLKRLIFAAATSVVLAISTVSIAVSDLAARGGYGDWPV